RRIGFEDDGGGGGFRGRGFQDRGAGVRRGELRRLVGREPLLQRGGLVGGGCRGSFGARRAGVVGPAGTRRGFEDFVKTAALAFHTPLSLWTTGRSSPACVLHNITYISPEIHSAPEFKCYRNRVAISVTPCRAAGA